MSAIDLISLSYSLKSGRTLFRGLNANFRYGEFISVIGPNGTGKSTLLKIIAHLMTPERGKVYVDGIETGTASGFRSGKLAREFARRISYLPQNTPIYHDMRIKDIVVLGRAPYLKGLSIWSDEDYRLVERYLELVGLAGFSERPVFSLSGGEFQRAMLARMLITEADILILDEPVTALDIRYSLEFLELCTKFCGQKKLIIIAIHDLELARRYSNQVLCLGADAHGNYLSGSPVEVLTKENIENVFQVTARFRKDGFLLYPKGD